MSNLAEALVIEHGPLVKRIAYNLKARLPPSVLVDDLIQVGMIGLLEASKNYQPDRGASFETYSGIRIRGAMLDELRRNDWAPKSVYKKKRELEKAIQEIESRTGRDARAEEILVEMEISQAEYHKILLDISNARIHFFEDLSIDENTPEMSGHENLNNPMEQLFEQRLNERLLSIVADLPEREKLAVRLYYDSQMNLRQISEVINVSEGRVSQLLSQAMVRLRARMRVRVDVE